jgi:anti-anti-sigma factor
MAFTVQVRSEHQATVLACKGTIVFGDESDALRAAVKERLRQHSAGAPGPWLVLDLSQVRYVDSGGLGALVGVLTSTRAAGGDLRLAGANERVGRVLKTTHLDKVFHIHATAEEAVKSFEAGSTASTSGAAD